MLGIKAAVDKEAAKYFMEDKGAFASIAPLSSLDAITADVAAKVPDQKTQRGKKGKKSQGAPGEDENQDTEKVVEKKAELLVPMLSDAFPILSTRCSSLQLRSLRNWARPMRP